MINLLKAINLLLLTRANLLKKPLVPLSPAVVFDTTKGTAASISGGNCSVAIPCGLCETDCDKDDECKPGLRCSNRETINLPVLFCNGANTGLSDYCQSYAGTTPLTTELEEGSPECKLNKVTVYF
jgi:hypothetical protein